MKLLLILILSCAVLQACSTGLRSVKEAPKGYSSAAQQETVGVYKIGNPYWVNGVRYVPREDPTYDQIGIASWYGSKFQGRRTANGETFDMYQMTAAHTTLPMPSEVEVTNLQNGRSIIVRVNDRGPFVDNRIIDLSYKAAQELGFYQQGTTQVRVKFYSPAVGAAAKPKVTKQELEALEKERRIQTTATPATVRDQPSTRQVAAVELAPLSEPAAAAPSQPAIAKTPDQDSRTEVHIQIGAYTDPKNAARMKAQVSSYYAAHIRGAMVNDRQYYRVRLGPFPSKQAASVVHAQLVEAGYDGARITVEKFIQ